MQACPEGCTCTGPSAPLTVRVSVAEFKFASNCQKSKKLEVRNCQVSRIRRVLRYRGASPIRRRPPPSDPSRTLGIGLL